MKILLALVTSLAFAAGSSAQDFSKAEVKAQKLADTLWMLQGMGGNLGLSAGEDSVFLVDDQYAPMTAKIQAAVSQVTRKPVQFVLNTHWHGDHTGGNENFGKGGAVIVAHDNVRKRMGTEQFLEIFKEKVPPSPKAALPVVTFANGITFHLNGEEIRVTHVANAHTDGDAIVHFVGADVVHMGDVFFNGLYPFIDAGSGGSSAGVIAACDQVLAATSDKTRFIPGHGPLATRADLKAYRDMLAALRERFARAIAEGKSDDDIAKAGLTKDYDEKWGRGFLKPEAFAKVMASATRKPR